MTRNLTLTSAAAALVTVVVLPLAAQLQQGLPPAKPQKLAAVGTAARGAQLVSLGGCHDCHTPKLPDGQFDMSKALMGHPVDAPLAPEVVGGASTNLHLTAWRGPWGLTLARNLTPDKETGIGSWTMADFKKTMRTGINPKGEALRPPMPVMNLQNLPDSDLEAIYLHLREQKPIKNPVGRTAPTQPTGHR